MSAIIYSGQDIQIWDEQLPECSDVLVISFPVRAERPSFQRKGFAERWCRKLGISAIDVKVSWNHWFQTPETDAAMAEIAKIASRYQRVVTYGSSMGAYGAIACSRAIGAHVAIAVSPQWTVDTERTPWEKRWIKDAALIRERFGFPRDDLKALANTSLEVYVLADGWDNDRHHARKIIEDLPQTVWLLANGHGHSAARGLVEAKVLGAFAQAMMLGNTDVAHWRRVLRESRRKSARYLSNLSARSSARGQRGMNLAVWASKAAASLPTADETTLRRAATTLMRAGHTGDALALFQNWRSQIVSESTEWLHTELVIRAMAARIDRLTSLDADSKRLDGLRSKIHRLAAGI